MRFIRLAVLIASTLFAALLVAASAFATLAQAQVNFSDQDLYAAGNGPVSVAVGDFNRDNDSYPDLAVANEWGFPDQFSDTNVSVLLGGDEGSFSGPTNFTVGPFFSFPSSVAVGDFDGGGGPDLAVANQFSGDVSVLLGNGSGDFGAATNFAAGGGPASVAVGDFNRDTDPDLAVANKFPGNVSVLLGGADGGFGDPAPFAAGNGPASVAVGDFNRDNNPDLAVANQSSNDVSVLLGDGDGGFSGPAPFAAGVDPVSVAVGDFDGDNDPDLAVARQSPSGVSVLLGDGDGRFGDPAPFAAGVDPVSVAVGDFNVDGGPDLAVANQSSNNVSVLLGDGDGGFSGPTNFLAGDGPSSVAVGDFNGGGGPDLAVANVRDNTVSVLLNTTQPTLTIHKSCQPTSDTGSFNLRVDDNTIGAAAGCGDDRTIKLSPGSYSVSETGAGSTVLSDYVTTIGGDCVADGSITLAAGQSATCTVTNARKAELTVNKVCQPANDPGRFVLAVNPGNHTNEVGCGGSLGPVRLSPGSYSVSETAGQNTNLSDYDSTIGGACAANGSIMLAAGQSATCTVTNARKAKLTVNMVVADLSAFGGSGGVIRVNGQTGARTTVSRNSSPTGTTRFVDPIALVFEASGKIVVADRNAFGGGGGVIRVNAQTGVRTTVSRNSSPSGATNFVEPTSIAVEANGNILVADSGAFGGSGGVIRVNGQTGARTTVSRNSSPTGTTRFVEPTSVAVEANGNILVADSGAFGGSGGVIRVNAQTGVRTTVSRNSSPTGTTSFVDPVDVAVEANGNILVADSGAFGGSGGVIRVNAQTGVRTTVSRNSSPTGTTSFVDPISLVADSSGSILVADVSAFGGSGGVIRVNGQTGVRTTVSRNSSPAGTTSFVDPVGIALEPTPCDQRHVVVGVMRRDRLDVGELRVKTRQPAPRSGARGATLPPRPRGQGRPARCGSW